MIVCIEAVAMPWKRQGLRRVRDVDIFAYCPLDSFAQLGKVAQEFGLESLVQS